MFREQFRVPFEAYRKDPFSGSVIVWILLLSSLKPGRLVNGFVEGLCLLRAVSSCDNLGFEVFAGCVSVGLDLCSEVCLKPGSVQGWQARVTFDARPVGTRTSTHL